MVVKWLRPLNGCCCCCLNKLLSFVQCLTLGALNVFLIRRNTSGIVSMQRIVVHVNIIYRLITLSVSDSGADSTEAAGNYPTVRLKATHFQAQHQLSQMERRDTHTSTA